MECTICNEIHLSDVGQCWRAYRLSLRAKEVKEIIPKQVLSMDSQSNGGKS